MAIEHRIDIAAPAGAVWRLVSDFEAWQRWNPLYPAAQAVSGLGDTVNGTIALPGMKPGTFSATICDWTPGRSLGWRVSSLGGLMCMTRYMVIEPVDEQHCRFVHGEVFGGLAGRLVGLLMRSKVEAGYRAMSEALKAAAEA